MTAQLSFADPVWPCDICMNGVETDPEDGLERRCRVCEGTTWLDYDPAVARVNAFAGLEEQ